MNKKLLAELKEKLEKEKILIENDLKNFAKEDKKLKGDWDTKYPQFQTENDGQQLEEAADEVEDYVNRLPVEHSLELRIQKINSALEKINKKKGGYGKCQKCGKKIEEEKIKAYPAAEFCSKCRK